MNFCNLLSEFSGTTWIAILSFVGFLVILLTILFQLLPNNSILFTNEKGCFSSFQLALEQSLKTALKISVNCENRSVTYRTLLIITSIYGFVVITHFEAYLGSTLIVEKVQDEFKSWMDVAESDLKILTWHASISEAYFRDSPSQSVLQQIYKEKVANEKSLDDIGFKRSIHMIVNDRYAAFANHKLYSPFKEFPCEIDSVKSPLLR